MAALAIARDGSADVEAGSDWASAPSGERDRVDTGRDGDAERICDVETWGL